MKKILFGKEVVVEVKNIDNTEQCEALEHNLDTINDEIHKAEICRDGIDEPIKSTNEEIIEDLRKRCEDLTIANESLKVRSLEIINMSVDLLNLKKK